MHSHSRYNRSNTVFTPKFNGWSNDPDFCDIGCYVCDAVLLLAKSSAFIGARDPAAKIGVVITDLRPHAEAERNKVIKAELERGFAIVPRRHLLHMKGMRETYVFCRALFERLHREAGERAVLDCIHCAARHLMVESARKSSSNIVCFRQGDEDDRQALARMIYEASKQEHLL